jgi:hypothetical protein
MNMKKVLIAVVMMTITGGAYAETAKRQLFGNDAPADVIAVSAVSKSVDDPTTGAEAYKKLEKMYTEGQDLKLQEVPNGEYRGFLVSVGGVVSMVKLENIINITSAGPLMPNLEIGTYNVSMVYATPGDRQPHEYSGYGDISKSAFYVTDSFARGIYLSPRMNNGYLIVKVDFDKQNPDAPLYMELKKSGK